jgi:tetratricopeptide (TPR) repeat protein
MMPRSSPRPTFAALAVTLLASLPGFVGAQGGPPRLGRIDFPVTASTAAHGEFETGVLWLHSFEYSRAAAAFQRAQQLEPGFVMAYWGEAMTHTHPVWNEQDLPAARAILNRLGPDGSARLGRAPNPRERLYLGAVEALYGEGPKPRRDTLYAEAMERLVRAHPGDLEAKAFYALAMIGLSQGIRDTATYRRAAAWADTVFAANPEHPGAAHYLIHAWDDPFNARLGLAAARAYSSIAPDAAHAQHMTTHIFLALGMWEDVVSQNTLAMDLTNRLPGHYTSWLHYALLQQGQIREATAFLEEMRENMATRRVQREPVLAWMRLAQVLTSDQWDTGPALWMIDVTGHPPEAQAAELYVRGLAAAQLGRRPGLDSAIAALAAVGAAAADPTRGEVEVQRLALVAWRHHLAGRRAESVATALRAVRLQEGLPLEFGPPAVAQPSHELLGLLLESGDPAGAADAYQRSLELAPGRALSLLGLARSARAAGNLGMAREALRQLVAAGGSADPAWREELRLLAERLSPGG